MDGKLIRLSLGQGQGPGAQRAIEQGCQSGAWVLLENCHLMPSWMSTLTVLVDNLASQPESVHPDFRLWLSSYPSEKFPVLILQNSVKLTMEAPGGLKANLLSSFRRDPMCDEGFYDPIVKPLPLRTLTMALCFFHAVVHTSNTPI